MLLDFIAVAVRCLTSRSILSFGVYIDFGYIYIDMFAQKGREIQISDLYFIRRGHNQLNYLLENDFRYIHLVSILGSILGLIVC
jgi:hypothetical protein